MAGLRKILIVEDNEQLREIYATFLQANDFKIVVAIDGDEALDVAKKEHPDLIFLDIMLPKRDGFTLLKLLRHEPEYNCTKAKIVMLTNLGNWSKVSPEVHKDMDGYVVKAEIVLTDLLEIIASLK